MRRTSLRLQPVIDHDAVTAPCQQRSRRTFERILAALGELLGEKSFDLISMAELAERAGCSVTSIYARFKDKWSMIAALHEGFRDDAIVAIDAFLAPQRWRGAATDAILAEATAALVDVYSTQRHLMRAVLLTDDPRVYARAISVEQYVADRLVDVLPAPAGEAAAFRTRVRFGIGVVLAALEQAVLFGECAKPPTARANAEFAAKLADLLTAYLEYPRRGRRGAAPRPTAPVGKRHARSRTTPPAGNPRRPRRERPGA